MDSELLNLWTPVFNGVTTFCEFFKIRNSKHEIRNKHQCPKFKGSKPSPPFGFRISSLTPRLKSLLLACVTAVSFLGAGCAHLSPDLTPNNVAPLFHVQTNPEKESRRIDAAGPFYSQSETPEEREWSLRPFFWYRENSRTRPKRRNSSIPWAGTRKTPEERSMEFLPLYRDKKQEPSEEDRKDYVDLFPFFWGRSKTGEAFGGFFPLGGVFKDRFVRDEITFRALAPVHPDPGRGNRDHPYPLAGLFPHPGWGDIRVSHLALLRARKNRKGKGPMKRPFSSGPSAITSAGIWTRTTPRPISIFFRSIVSEQIDITKTDGCSSGRFSITTGRPTMITSRWTSPGR